MYCECGCGRVTTTHARTNNGFGYVKGEHLRFIKGHASRKSPVDFLEEDRGAATPCHIWQLETNGVGYGVLSPNGRRAYAHRHAYEQARGPIPDGLDLDHVCRQTLCVNPDHLEPVTKKVNNNRGKSTKLTDEQVAEIRASTEIGPIVAARYGISKNYVYNLRNGYRR